MAMKHIVEKTNDPEIRASRWRVLLVVARRSPHFGSEEQKEVFHDAHQAALRIGNPIRRSTLLLELAAETYGSEAGTLLEEVVEIIVPHGDETVSANDDRVSLMKQAISLLVERGNAERMLEIVHSPDIPDDWKLELYRKAADALRHDPNISVFDDDPNPIFFRANDHKKLIDLIESRK